MKKQMIMQKPQRESFKTHLSRQQNILSPPVSQLSLPLIYLT